MSTIGAVYDQLYIHVSDRELSISPASSPNWPNLSTLVISRSSGTISVNSPPSSTLVGENVISAYGIIGILKLHRGDHLVYVTGKTRLGRLLGHDIFKLDKHETLPILTTAAPTSPVQLQEDEKCLNLVKTLLTTSDFYFSYTFDLLTRLQTQFGSSYRNNMALWERVDDRFYWNKHLQQPMIHVAKLGEVYVNEFLLPIMCGCILFKELRVEGNPIQLLLLSRRSKFRAGVRYFMRGIDKDGNVANFVETEQILWLPDRSTLSSYLQVRGSIPIYWRQEVNSRYRPILTVTDNASNGAPMRKHLSEILGLYGSVLALNLINEHGYEGRLNTVFSKEVSLFKDPKFHYVFYDFHKNCKKDWVAGLARLQSLIQADLRNQEYLVIDASRRPVKQQNLVVRTNCIDCLDRTNVVQSALSRNFINSALKSAGFTFNSEEWPVELENGFKNMWADHADIISKQYSGTDALKTDFTRTGKRTISGIINDLTNSIVRYVRSNFMDGGRQDSFDLFLGHLSVNELGLSDSRNTPAYVLLLPILTALSFIMLTLTLLMLSEFVYGWMYFIFWLICLTSLIMATLRYGKHYVNLPKSSISKLNYSDLDFGIDGSSVKMKLKQDL